jgi:hypothetical protein
MAIPAHPGAHFVLVSYSRAESAFAEKLALDLRAIGLHVWLDQAEIAPGADVVATINRGLAGAQWLVVVLTPNALASTFVRRKVNCTPGSKRGTPAPRSWQVGRCGTGACEAL